MINSLFHRIAIYTEYSIFSSELEGTNIVLNNNFINTEDRQSRLGISTVTPASYRHEFQPESRIQFSYLHHQWGNTPFIRPSDINLQWIAPVHSVQGPVEDVSERDSGSRRRIGYYRSSNRLRYRGRCWYMPHTGRAWHS